MFWARSGLSAAESICDPLRENPAK